MFKAAQAVERVVKVADQVWIATSLLHREHPDREGFSAAEIVERVRQEFGRVQPGITVHIYLHALANKQPNPGRYRILHEVRPGMHRLFRPRDPYHPDRDGAKFVPYADEIPEKYRSLLHWYEKEYAGQEKTFGSDSPMLRLLGVGNSGQRDISEHHDRYLAETVTNEPHKVIATETIRETLNLLFAEAEGKGHNNVKVNAGELHRRIGGYPGPGHRMPLVCHVMRREMKAGDSVVKEPEKGAGASLTIVYRLPR